MGGLVVLQSLLQSKNGGQYQEIFNSTHAILFFGTPHQGLEVDDLAASIQEESRGESSRPEFLRQLRKGSNFLRTQKEDITNLWVHSHAVEIVSFYETRKTAAVIMSSGRLTRSGKEVEMVQKDSAQLFWSFEHRVSVNCNHIDMVKFGSNVDSTYQTVVTRVDGCVKKIVEAQVKQNEAAKLTLTVDQKNCLQSLKASDYESYRDNLLFKRHENTCTWLLVDERYRNWISSNNPILWIHGAPGSGKSVLSSVLSKHLECYCDAEISFQQNYSVAYFFCDDKDERLNTAYAVLANLLAQLLKQEQDVIVHFSTESEYSLNKEKTSWNFGMLWRVFERIVRDNSDKIKPMCIIIDALGM
ncbi:hypothetical protein K440DRAFT_121039 [Wilcoxina mikolae CBS 423.85]|nr:hypothetical protein K440DRAFT_121039 [Wilcoxina mikolae CBS 423.85]